MHVTKICITQNVFLDAIKRIIKVIFHLREKVNIPGKKYQCSLDFQWHLMYLSSQEKISALFLINFKSHSKIQGNIYSQQAMRRQSQRIQRSRSRSIVCLFYVETKNHCFG